MGTKKAPDKACKHSRAWRFRRLFTLHVLHFVLFGFVAFAFCGNAAYSQDITVSADVTPKIISLNETATLRVTIFRQPATGEYCTAKVTGIAGVQYLLRRLI